MSNLFCRSERNVFLDVTILNIFTRKCSCMTVVFLPRWKPKSPRPEISSVNRSLFSSLADVVLGFYFYRVQHQTKRRPGDSLISQFRTTFPIYTVYIYRGLQSLNIKQSSPCYIINASS